MPDTNSVIKKKSYFWNTLSGLVNASEAVVVLAVVNRLLGSNDAGILALAFSISNLSMAIGKFGMRTLQVTDIDGGNTFSLYFSSRIISFFAMLVFTVLYLASSAVLNNYSFFKCQVIFLLFLLYSIEVIEDVFLSEYQRKGRLDFGAKMFTIRWIISLFVLCFLVYFVDLRIALFVSVVISAIVLLFFLFHYNKFFDISINPAFIFHNNKRVFNLLKSAFPLFVSSFAYLFLNNIQKFAIDKYLTENDQASFGYIVMPVFVLPLLSSFIIQPSLVTVTNAFKERNYNVFNKSIKINLLFIFVMFLICEAGAFILGIPVLNVIYKADLAAYKYDLLILLAGGSFLALANYISVLFTIMRKQNLSMCIYIIGSFIGTLSAYTFTAKFGVRGSSLSYSITMFSIAILFVVIFFIRYKYYKKGLHNGR